MQTFKATVNLSLVKHTDEIWIRSSNDEKTINMFRVLYDRLEKQYPKYGNPLRKESDNDQSYNGFKTTHPKY